jgi:ferredoxin
MTRRLQVDPTRCDGQGGCAELLPELISLDEWGYPVLAAAAGRAGTPVPAELRRHARRAVTLCPTLALRLVTAAPADRLPTPGQRAQTRR